MLGLQADERGFPETTRSGLFLRDEPSLRRRGQASQAGGPSWIEPCVWTVTSTSNEKPSLPWHVFEKETGAERDREGRKKEAGRRLSQVFLYDHQSIVVYACFTNFGEQ